MSDYIYPIIAGVIAGIATRLYMLKTDYRQYPTYVHGKVIHIALGLIAAGLGAIIMPALLQEEFTAITFLTLAATQFRDVRNMERNTLTQMDSYELVSRGSTYIEGIAIAFESRNYIVIFTALLTTSAYVFFIHLGCSHSGCRLFFTGHEVYVGQCVEGYCRYRVHKAAL